MDLTSESPSKEYLNFLDGLRAVAVLSVVSYHLFGSGVPNGFLGVDVFFVISGFVVSYVVSSRYSGESAFHYVMDFYARRFTRIMPALLVCLLVSALATYLFVPDAWLSTSISDTAYFAFFGMSNIFLASGTDYFSPVTEFNPFTHTWSLGVEEQFYLVFPLLFLPWVLGGPRGRKFSTLVYGALAVASLAAWVYLLAAQPLHAFYMPWARFWQLACGILCFQLVSRLRRSQTDRGKVSSNAIATVALLGLLTTLLIGPAGWANAAAVACATCLIGSLYYLGPDRASHLAVLEIPAVRFIGWISYSLYLWHWPVFVIARWTIGMETTITKLVALLVAVALSLASYFWVELPTRRSLALKALPDFAIVTIFLAVICGAFYSFTVMRDDRFEIALSTVMQNRAEWYATAPDRFPDFPNCIVMAKSDKQSLSFAKGGCPFGERKETLFVLGDSHAGAYLPLLKRFTLVTGIRTVIVWTAGCPFISLDLSRDTGRVCASAATAGVGYIVKVAKPGDLLFLSSLRLPRFSMQWSATGDDPAANDKDRGRAVKSAIDILRPLTRAGLSVVFEAPKPVFRSPAFRCSDWFNSMNPACAGGTEIDRQLIETLRAPVLSGFAEISAALPNISVWDPLPKLCPLATCSVFQNGQPLYFDGDHITAYANAILVDDFAASMENVIRASHAG
ncbi:MULTISPECIES: acyltransferase family protein [unclassified Mesorhizobium]|uniref:acyltransferase family protein n=1 Tax=unclassified Mesorhizobium TaxID=325217 RepID=UPI00112E4CEB|nr:MULTISPECIES: acyltransferase family protein [unclassified Mesorhizobium]MBZ9693569.1 acyltransferase [Mesorhizobium sp. CO1-1-9]TPK17412.1 acyltransferase [Mesorhizobium sp. B2-5-7]